MSEEPSEKSPESEPVVNWIKTHSSSIAVTVIGGLIVVGLSFLIFGGDNSSPTQITTRVVNGQAVAEPSKPETALDAIEEMPFWTSSPNLVEASIDGDISNPIPFEPIYQDLVNVQTPKDLVLRGAGFNKRVIFVGRYAGVQVLDNEFFRYLVHLKGEPGFDVYVGTFTDPIFYSGKNVYGFGRVAAVGQSQAADGQASQTAFMLVGEDPEFLNEASSPGSDNVRAALQTIGRPQ